jgi:hypothetical protein
LIEKANAGYTRFKVIVAERFEIGFDNAENDDYEKNGSFMFYIKHLYYKKKDDNTSHRDFDDDTITLCNSWNSMNIITDATIIKEIVAKAYDEILKLDIALEEQIVIMPMVATVYDSMIHFVKIQRAEQKEFEYEINFMSLFDVRAQESDDGEDIIAFTPAIENKLMLKDDGTASSKFD